MNPKSLTCRYWAFGTRCPNYNKRGVDICPYAHYDTGQLVSHLQQRGTCASWLKDRCPSKGDKCFYEHRTTGVPGLYQGVINLWGLNLEIADAAAVSGFDTSDHAALFDLIWSVKRLNLPKPFKPSVSQLRSRPMPKPKHPIYPDRYRPSGVGDNTKRKRPLLDDPDYLSNHFMANVIEARLRTTQVNEPKRTTNQTGTQAAPIIIDVDEERHETSKTATSTKRQRLDDDSATRATIKQEMKEKFELFTSTQLPLRAKPSTPNLNLNLNLKPSLATDLENVKDKLFQAQQLLLECQTNMKSIFDQHAEKLSADSVLPHIMTLKEGIFNAQDGTYDGVEAMMDLLKMISG